MKHLTLAASLISSLALAASAAEVDCGCEGETEQVQPALINPELRQYVTLKKYFSTPSGEEIPLTERHSACIPCEKHWSLTLESGLDSKYWTRGRLINSDPVMQSSVTAAYHLVTKDDEGKNETDYGTFGLQWWGNHDLDTDSRVSRNSSRMSENDWTGFWQHGIADDAATIEVGHVYYDFAENNGPDSENYTAEVYTKLTLNNWLNPFIAANYDYQNGNGFYLQGGVGHKFKLLDLSDKPTVRDDLTFDLSSAIGWADNDIAGQYYNQKSSTWTDYSISAGLTVPFWRADSFTMSFRPYVKWFTALDRVDNDDLYAKHSHYNGTGVAGGAGIVLEF